MKKIELGQTIQILANLGVIAGIIFLGVEIRQNTDVLQLQIEEMQLSRDIANNDSSIALISVLSDASALINSDAETWAKGSRREPLTDAEAAIFQNQVVTLNRAWFGQWNRAQNFLGSEIGRAMAINFAAELYDRPGARDVWEAYERRLASLREAAVGNAEPALARWAEEVLEYLANIERAGL